MSIYPDTVEEIQFYTLGDADNISASHVEVTNKHLFQGNLPIENGIYDAHMGTTDHSWNCQTCFNSKLKCPGHDGHLSLNYPVQSPMFKDDIIQWLKVICFECGSLVIDKILALRNISIHRRLSEYVKITRAANKNISCYKCNAIHPHVYRDKNRGVVIWAEVYIKNKQSKIQLFNHLIATIFERISSNTIALMGKQFHPRKYILSVIRVPANTIRPDIKQMGGGRSNNNNITTLLKAIVENNNNLPIVIPKEIPNVLELSYTNQDLLYYEMVQGTPPTSTKNKIITNTNKPLTSLSSRFTQKTGRIRKNLMGSRSWYTARSVITCDPVMRIDELGIPVEIAVGIQIPEVVNSMNRDRLMVYFNNKRLKYPGCTHVIKKRTGIEHCVQFLNKSFVLEYGDTVVRDVIDGDVVMFNRQPTMFGYSVACHKISVISEGSTIRMNISACSLYNADFDGDAMNLYFARSMQARNEIETISGVGSHFISKPRGHALIGCFQDVLASVVELTHSNVVIPKYKAMQIFRNIDMPFNKEQYTGRELLSMVLPPINFTNISNFYNKAYAPYLKYREDEVKLIIENGIIKQGILDVKSIGQKTSNTIFHIIHNEYGPDVVLDVIYKIQQIAIEFMYYKGFTIKGSDIDITDDALVRVQEKTTALLMDAERITEKLIRGDIIPPINMTIEQFYEQQQISIVSLGDDFVEPVLSDVDTESNGLYKLIQMCKGGSIKNFQAITSAVGSSLINGQRASKSFGHGRTLPYFTRFDTNPVSNGFIAESYITGLSPTSFIFMAQEARYSAVNRALSTAIGGSQSREGIKNMESVLVNNHRQCTKHRNIVQFLYAGTGINPTCYETVHIPTVMLTDVEFKKYHSDVKMFDTKFHNDSVQKLLDDEFKQLSADRQLYRDNFLVIGQTYIDKNISSKYKSPVNINRIIIDVINATDDKKLLDPVKALTLINKTRKEFPYLYMNMQRYGSHIPDKYVKITDMLWVLIRSYMNTKYLIKNSITNKMLSVIVTKILVSMRKSLIDYGTAVGITAAQSISEPITQRIIDSHLRVGISSGLAESQTDSLTRTNEIMNARTTDNMKHPAMTLFVKTEYSGSQKKVEKIAARIESMRLRQFLSSFQIFFEDYKKPVHPQYKHEVKLIDLFEKHNPNIVLPTDLTKWVIRFELNRLSIILKNMDLETIVYGIMNAFPTLHVVYSPENHNSIIIRCYIRSATFTKARSVGLPDIEQLKNSLLDIIVRGIPGISKAVVVKSNRYFISDDGGVDNAPYYVIRTTGTNLNLVMENKYVDINLCYTDSIKEMEEIYGIEAARHKLRIELELLVPGICSAHYSVYADEMCRTGTVTAISKSGLERREPGNIMLRTSYSHAKQTLKAAAVDGKHNKIYGASAPLMLGRVPYVGTGYNQIAVDYDFVNSNTVTASSVIDDL